jgi:hypothetical protein
MDIEKVLGPFAVSLCAFYVMKSAGAKKMSHVKLLLSPVERRAANTLCVEYTDEGGVIPVFDDGSRS